MIITYSKLLKNWKRWMWKQSCK